MEQRDYLKDQIEQIGKVIAKILSDFMGYKSTGQFSFAMEVSNEQLKSELDIDLSQLLELEKDDLRKYLIDRKINAAHIEILSKYLEGIGRTKMMENKAEGMRYLDRTLILFELSDELSNTISFERINRKAMIENTLQLDKQSRHKS